MKQDKQEVLTHLCTNVSQSVELFGQLLAVPKDAVSLTVRAQALLRRLRICFIALYEFLNEKAELTEEQRKKSLDEIADYFVTKKVIAAEDKDAFIMLGSVYTAIRWAKPGSAPDEQKILEQVDDLYAFLAKTTSYHMSQVPADSQKEVTP